MAKAKKGKQLQWVPQSREEVNTAIGEIGTLTRDRTVLEAEMNAKISAIQAEYGEQVAPLNARIELLSNGVSSWCQMYRPQLTQDGQVKFHDFATGRVNWHFTPWSVAVRGVEEVIKLLRRKRLSRYLRTKVEIDKASLLKDREKLDGKIEGITFKQEEVFSISPTGLEVDTETEPS